MRCLTDIEVQRAADAEGGAQWRGHLEGCARCRARLEERRAAMATLTQLMAVESPTIELTSRVRDVLRSTPSDLAPARGATVLRPSGTLPLRPVWATAMGVAATVAIVAFVLLPRLDTPTSLSAAEVIDRSLDRMTGDSGIERLEYELVMASSYRRSSGLSEGPFRVVQIFDRAEPARFKFQQFDSAGTLVSATAQDPSRSRRTEMLRVDDRDYVIHVTSLPGPLVSIPALLQSQGEAMLRMMQLNADEHLTVVDLPAGRAYVIEIPDLSTSVSTSAVPLDVARARLVIDGTDFRVLEFTAAGSLLGQPFDVSFKLLTQDVDSGTLPADAWEIQGDPDDVVIEGDGEGELTDSMSIVLRQLGRTRERVR